MSIEQTIKDLHSKMKDAAQTNETNETLLFLAKGIALAGTILSYKERPHFVVALAVVCRAFIDFECPPDQREDYRKMCSNMILKGTFYD